MVGLYRVRSMRVQPRGDLHTLRDRFKRSHSHAILRSGRYISGGAVHVCFDWSKYLDMTSAQVRPQARKPASPQAQAMHARFGIRAGGFATSKF